jgi:hypothetical protein
MRTPHLVTRRAIDTPSATATDDAGRMVILGDDGHVANGFLDVDLEALGNNSTNGILTRTGSGTVSARTITGTAGSVTVTNGDGVSGNPTISLDATLAALAAANWVANAIPIGSGADTLSQVTFAANTFPARASTGNLVAKTITDFGLSLVALSALAGSDTYVLYNDSGAIGANQYFKFNDTTYEFNFSPAGSLTYATELVAGGSRDTVTLKSFLSGGLEANLALRSRSATLDAADFTLTAGTMLLVGDDLGALTWRGNTLWHAGNDGAGSGLDADTLDGNNIGTSGATVPLLNGNNTVSGTWLFQLDTNANYVLECKNVDTGTSSAAVLRTASDSASFSHLSHAVARTVARCGQTLGGWNELLSFTGSGLLINTNNSAPMKFGTNNTLAATIDTSQNAVFTAGLTSSGATSGVGYSTGAGGTVTQATNKSTAVTLNKVTGTITMNGAALAAATTATFTLNNTAIAATDQIVVTHHSVGSFASYNINGRATGAGTASIAVRNITAGSLSEAIVLRFSVIKSVDA